MIELHAVSKTYPKGRLDVHALRTVTMHCGSGELVAIQGPSGSGKTTLLNLVGLLDDPTEGRILLGGRDTSGLSRREKARLRGGLLGFVFQSFNLIANLTAWQNVALPLYYAGMKRAKRRQQAIAALEQVGLAHRADHRPSELSGGEEQRVAIARSLVIHPKIVLADEPTGNLDSENGTAIMHRLEEVNGDGVSILIVSHDPIVVSFARRTLTLRDGVVTADQHPRE